MGKLLDRIAKDLHVAGFKARSRQSRAWLEDMVSQLGRKPNRAELLRDFDRMTKEPFVGKMFFYYYDPKGKDELPYYDRFPLVLPIDTYADGFLGLNVHYIPPKARVMLLDRLFDFATDKKLDQNTRIMASYSVLVGVSRYKLFEPCIKRYLSDHIASRVIAVEADKWDIACFLPVEYFAKASAQRVWTDSMNRR